MPVLVRTAHDADREAVQRLLKACGWDHPRITDDDRFAELFASADRSVVADDDETVPIGILSVTDVIHAIAMGVGRDRDGRAEAEDD